MKKIIIITSMLIVQLGFAQLTIKKSTIDSGGQIAQVGTTAIISTIGEVVVQENTQGTIHISEGFISPDILSSLSLDNYTVLEGISIYPNPTVDFVNLNFEHQDIYDISIFDINGKQLISKTVNTNNYQLDFTDYAQSVYLIVVKNKPNKTYRTFKIIKN